jgi:hypothetical protein
MHFLSICLVEPYSVSLWGLGSTYATKSQMYIVLRMNIFFQVCLFSCSWWWCTAKWRSLLFFPSVCSFSCSWQAELHVLGFDGLKDAVSYELHFLAVSSDWFFLVPGMSKQMFDVCMLLCVCVHAWSKRYLIEQETLHWLLRACLMCACYYVSVFMHDQKGISHRFQFLLVSFPVLSSKYTTHYEWYLLKKGDK